jgi:hypothetical protein
MPERYIVLRVTGLACHAVEGLGCGSRIAPLFKRIADLAPDTKTDHAGELLRFVDRGQSADVRARLMALGYGSEELAGGTQAKALESGWYAASDLSREEAQVLASKIVPAFAKEHAIDPAQAPALEQRVQGALFGCFTGIAIPSSAPSKSLPGACREAVAVAAAADGLVGAAAAADLGDFVERWLART